MWTKTMAMLRTVIVSAIVTATLGFQYQELQALKKCHPFDSCQRNISLPSSLDAVRNCQCDESCPLYDDCCLDSEYYSSDESSRNEIPKHTCVELTDDDAAYMKATCEEGWDDAEISALCLNGSPKPGIGKRDPVASLPATSLDTNITYANYYCAICNRDSKSLAMWNAGWDCGDSAKTKNLSEEYILSNLILKNNDWGVNVKREGTQEFVGCTVYPIVPERLQSVVRNCTQVISTCPEDWEDSNVRDLCHSYTAIVHGSTNYRNIHCAICNSIDSNDTHCVRNGLGRNDKKGYPSFAVLFDFTDSSGSNIVGSISRCEENEIWDPFFKKCRDVVCGKPNQVFTFNRCVDVGDFNDTTGTDRTDTPSSVSSTTEGFRGIPIVFPTTRKANETAIIYPNDTLDTPPSTTTTVAPHPISTMTVTGTAIASNGTDQFQKCYKVFLHDAEFVIYGNDTVYVQNYSRVYTLDEYQIMMGGILVCAPPTDTAKFSAALVWVSLVGTLASCLCLLLHLIAFHMVPDLRNLSGKNLASLCTALLAAYITFIVNMFIDPEPVNCMVLAAAMYYCFFSAFCWMNSTAFDIWYTFRLTKTELRVISGNQWHRFIAYSLYSWLLPAAALAIVISIDVWQPEGISEDFLPTLGTRWCWFGRRKALLVFFALPITIMIIVNCVFFVSTAQIIAETSMATSNNTTSSHNKNQFKMHMRLAVLLGFTWLAGTVAGYLQLEVLWYIFVVLNTLQGVFIFLAFTCRRKVWRVMGVTSYKILQRGSSWISRRIGKDGTQTMELKNSSSPSTSVDGW